MKHQAGRMLLGAITLAFVLCSVPIKAMGISNRTLQIPILRGTAETVGKVTQSSTAQPQCCGENITWEITDSGTLVLTGTGAMYDYDPASGVYAPWYEQRTSIKTIEIGDGITHVGNGAFYGSSTVTALSLPGSVTSIGSYAYYGLGMTSLSLHEGITEIGNGAFSNSSLRNVVLPDSLTCIPDEMFRNSYDLHTVDLPKMITYVGNSAFDCCYALDGMTLPEGLVSIGNSAFKLCGASYWYDNASYFDYINLPSTLETIGESAFAGCHSLENIVIPDRVTTIGYGAFNDCRSMRSATISANIESIADWVFPCTWQSKSLKTVTFRWALPTLGEETFYRQNITCYYPSNNPEWTADVLQNYGGTITWVGQEMEEPEASDAIEITVNNVGAAASGAVITAPEEGWKAGSNTFTVSCPNPCVVAVSYDGGETYTRLTAVAQGDAYSFTVEDMTADTILAVARFGDVDGNGKLTNLDAARCRSGYLRFLELDGLQQLFADANGDGKLTNLDAARLRSMYLRYIAPEW